MAMWISCWVQFSEKLARREKALSTFSDKSLQAALPRSVGPVTRLARVLIRQWNPFRPRPTLPQRQCAKDMRMSRPWSGNGLLNRCWLVSVLGWSRELLSHCSFSESRNPARASPATRWSKPGLKNTGDRKMGDRKMGAKNISVLRFIFLSPIFLSPIFLSHSPHLLFRAS